jgi:hypothetical protein
MVENTRPAEAVTVELEEAWTEEMMASNATRAKNNVEANLILAVAEGTQTGNGG